MIVGLDFYGTIQEKPAQFWDLAEALLPDNEVHIVTAVKEENLERVAMDVHDSKISYSSLNPLIFEDYAEVPLLKLQACQDLNIELFIDDRADVCELLKKNGILALCVV